MLSNISSLSTRFHVSVLLEDISCFSSFYVEHQPSIVHDGLFDQRYHHWKSDPKRPEGGVFSSTETFVVFKRLQILQRQKVPNIWLPGDPVIFPKAHVAILSLARSRRWNSRSNGAWTRIVPEAALETVASGFPFRWSQVARRGPTRRSSDRDKSSASKHSRGQALRPPRHLVRTASQKFHTRYQSTLSKTYAGEWYFLPMYGENWHEQRRPRKQASKERNRAIRHTETH